MNNWRIYLASSWRNPQQPEVLATLRADGHDVYDFRNPTPKEKGFSWAQVDPNWLKWTPETFIEKLQTHSRCSEGFQNDLDALNWCQICVLLLPCGRSAHLEAGFCIGKNKPTVVLLSPDGFEPDLMYLLSSKICSNLFEVREWLQS